MLTKKDIMRVYDEEQKENREHFEKRAAEIAAVINFVKAAHPNATIYPSDRTAIVKLDKDLVKEAYITIDELCHELNIDPKRVGEHYYTESIDFYYHYWRIEFHRAGVCRPIYKKKMVETKTVIGYSCS